MTNFFVWVRKNNWLVVALAIGLSFIYPPLGIALKPASSWLLVALVFLSCLDINFPAIKETLCDYKPQVLILLITHLAAPLLILPFRSVLSPEIYLGLIITAVSPAGRSTAFLANIYGGYPLKALVASTVSNALSPITMPALVWLFAHQVIEIDVASMSGTLFWLVIVPLVVAFFFGKTAPGKVLNTHSSSISVIVLFFILLSIISPLTGVILSNPFYSLIIAALGIYLLIACFFMGYFLGKTPADRITSAYKNYTLATIICVTLYSTTVSLVPILYSITNNLLLIPLSLSRRKST